jgi:hypothetical protein
MYEWVEGLLPNLREMVVDPFNEQLLGVLISFNQLGFSHDLQLTSILA